VIRHRVRSICLAALLLTTLAGAAGAQEVNVTIDDLRANFQRQGYQVDEAIVWDWLAPPVTSFHVIDEVQNRILVVEVFADVGQAHIEESRTVGGVRVDNVLLFEYIQRVVSDEEPTTRPVEGDFVGLVRDSERVNL